MESKKNEGLRAFLRAHEHAAPVQPAGEWNQIVARIVEEAEAVKPVPRGWWRQGGIGAGLCVASFAAAFLWMSSMNSLNTSARPATVGAIGEGPVIDTEDFVWEAMIGEDEGLEEFEQAYVDVLER